jgi:hypothetical protein
MTQPTRLSLTIRQAEGNDNHHLWNNNGTWWCHFSLKDGQGHRIRVRRSLRTRNLAQARAKRDQLLESLKQASGKVVV